MRDPIVVKTKLDHAGHRRDYRARLYERYESFKTNSNTSSAADYARSASALHARVGDWLPADRQTPIVDLGCGNGSFLYLLRRLGYSNIAGIDISPEQIALASEWCPEAVVSVGDVAEMLAANPQRFGLITAFDVFEHFDKDELLATLDLVVKALQPGGRLIMQMPNGESPWFGSLAYGDFTHELTLTPAGLERLTRLSGLAEFEARECGPVVHGVKSAVRGLLWRTIHAGLELWNVVETGDRGGGVYTRAFIASAKLPRSGV